MALLVALYLALGIQLGVNENSFDSNSQLVGEYPTECLECENKPGGGDGW